MPALAPRYNVAPGQPVGVVGLKADGVARGLTLMRWGLIPRAAAAPPKRPPHAVRAEAAARSPATREGFARRRCLLPADGFYLWQAAGLAKVPHHVRPVGGGVMALAGVWDVWTGPDGQVLRTCGLLTVPAAGTLRHLGDRTPAVLPAEAWSAWLSPATPASELKGLLRPVPAERMAAVTVGPAVNSIRNDGPECVRPGGRPDHTSKPFG